MGWRIVVYSYPAPLEVEPGKRALGELRIYSGGELRPGGRTVHIDSGLPELSREAAELLAKELGGGNPVWRSKTKGSISYEVPLLGIEDVAGYAGKLRESTGNKI